MPRANARAVRKRHVPWKAERSLPSPEVLLFDSTTWRAVDPCGHGLIRREKTSEGIANAEDVSVLSKLHVTNCYCRLKLKMQIWPFIHILVQKLGVGASS